QESPWQLCRRGFAKTNERKKETSRKSPQCGHAAEADFGELRYLDAAWLKAGAHYTGNYRKRELFLSPESVRHRCVTGFCG
ncbi:MAG: hypothetical protein RR740_25245, partial [Pseudomonas sp.]